MEYDHLDALDDLRKARLMLEHLEQNTKDEGLEFILSGITDDLRKANAYLSGYIQGLGGEAVAPTLHEEPAFD